MYKVNVVPIEIEIDNVNSRRLLTFFHFLGSAFYFAKLTGAPAVFNWNAHQILGRSCPGQHSSSIDAESTVRIVGTQSGQSCQV